MQSISLYFLGFSLAAMSWFTQAQPFALTQPYFEMSGGVLHVQPVVPGGNFIPVGSTGVDSRDGSPAVTVTLRDPGYSGIRAICVDYVGTDASFENQFQAPGINWCNKASCTDTNATGVGVGSKDWNAGTPTICFDATVDQPVPFTFISDVLAQGVDGTHVVGNGQTTAGAHWAPLAYPFVTTNPPPTTSEILALGLSDGAFNPSDDDDHQDFAVRFTVTGIPIPPVVTAVPTLPQSGLLILAALLVFAGFIGVRRLA